MRFTDQGELCQDEVKHHGGDGTVMRLSWDRVISLLLIMPSVIAMAVFVYGFIGWTAWVSLSKWDGLRSDLRG